MHLSKSFNLNFLYFYFLYFLSLFMEIYWLLIIPNGWLICLRFNYRTGVKTMLLGFSFVFTCIYFTFFIPSINHYLCSKCLFCTINSWLSTVVYHLCIMAGTMTMTHKISLVQCQSCCVVDYHCIQSTLVPGIVVAGAHNHTRNSFWANE